MTIARFVVQIAGDARSLHGELARTQRFLNDFQQRINRARPIMLQGLQPYQLRIVQGSIANFVTDVTTRFNALRQNLQQGIISPREFARQANAASREFITTFSRNMQGFVRQGFLTPAQATTIMAQIRGVMASAAAEGVRSFGEGLLKVGQVGTTVGSQLTRNVTLPLVGIGTASVKAAAEAEASAGRLGIVWGRQTKVIQRSLDELHDSIPATNTELQNFAAIIGEITISLGVAPDRAAAMSIELVKLAKDLALLNRISTERAFNALASAMLGQSYALRRLGVGMSAAARDMEALELAQISAKSELSERAKAEAAFNVIMRRTIFTQDAVNKLNETASARFLFLRRAIVEAGIAIGNAMLPAVKTLTIFLEGLAKRVSSLTERQIALVIKVAAFAAAAGPLILILSNLAIAVGVLSIAFAGLSAVMGPLVVVGVVIAALVGFKIVSSFREAARAASDYRSVLAGLSRETLQAHAAALKGIITQQEAAAQRIAEQIADLRRTGREAIGLSESEAATRPAGAFMLGLTSDQRRQYETLRQQLVGVERALAAFREQAQQANEQLALQQSAAAEAEREFQKYDDLLKTIDTSMTMKRPLAEIKSLAVEARAAATALSNAARAGIGVTDALAKARDVATRVREEIAQQGPLTSKNAQAMGILQNALKALETAINATAKLDLTEFSDEVGIVIKRLELAVEATGRGGAAVAAPLRDADALIADIVTRLEQVKGNEEATNKLLQLRLQLLNAINDALPTQFKGIFPNAEAEIRKLAEAFVVAKTNLEALTSLGGAADKALVAAAQKTFEALRTQLRERIQSLLQVISVDTALPSRDKAAVIKDLEALLRGIGTSFDEIVDKGSKTEQLFARMATFSRGILTIADAFGEVSQSLRQLLNGFTVGIEGARALAEAMRAMKLPASEGGGMTLNNLTTLVSGITGLIAGLVGVIGSMFGKSAGERERDAILRENNQRLAELALAPKDFVGGLGDVVGIRNALIAAMPEIQRIERSGLGRTTRSGMIEAELRRAGISLDELAAIAETVGINIRDAEGRLIGPALEQLATALRDFALQAVRFSRDLDDQRRIREIRADLLDEEVTPVSTIQRELDLLKLLAPELFETFQGLDATTEAGRAAIEQALRDLFEAIVAGTIDPEQFGGLRNLEELLSIITGVEGALDELAEAARETVDALRNVPEGFKIAQAIFDATQAVAQSPWTRPGPAQTPAGPLQDLPVGMRPPRGGDIQFTGPITIDAKDRTIKETFDELVDMARRTAREQTGDSSLPFTKIK